MKVKEGIRYKNILDGLLNQAIHHPFGESDDKIILKRWHDAVNSLYYERIKLYAELKDYADYYQEFTANYYSLSNLLSVLSKNGTPNAIEYSTSLYKKLDYIKNQIYIIGNKEIDFIPNFFNKSIKEILKNA